MRPLAKDDPREIGPFRIIGLLGGGGMGRVYLGRAADGRTVAVKTARAELADDDGFRARFAREVAAARRVAGPFVAPVVDAAPHDDIPWMATAYVPGVSLTVAVRDGGPLPDPALRMLTAGLLHALAAVHAHGLVHRDLKPSNILLTADGPRVIDFGIAHSAADTALTVTGTALGTPGFMAPEQLAMNRPRVTGAADVFALGGVIVFAATGSGPFGSTEPQVLMYRTVHEEPQLDGVPASLRELAGACLAKEPERRPTVAALMARVGTPGPYGDWLPEPVAAQLGRLSAWLGDPRVPDTPDTPPARAAGPVGRPDGARGTGGAAGTAEGEGPAGTDFGPPPTVPAQPHPTPPAPAPGTPPVPALGPPPAPAPGPYGAATPAPYGAGPASPPAGPGRPPEEHGGPGPAAPPPGYGAPGPVPPPYGPVPPPHGHGVPGPSAPPQDGPGPSYDPPYDVTPALPGHSSASPAHSPAGAASPGPGRRRVIAALSAAGLVAGGGALAWTLWPDGAGGSGDREGGGDGSTAGDKPGGNRQPATDPAPSRTPTHAATPSEALPKEIRDRGVLTIGSDLTYPPMEFRRGGEVAGVDIDLGKALGRELGIRVEFRNSVFDSLLAGLAAGRHDLVMSAMADTQERREGRVDGVRTGAGVDFVDYFSAGLAVVVRKGNPEGVGGPEDLSGRTVTVQRGTVAHDYLDRLNRRRSKKVTIRETDTTAEAYGDVAAGRSSACLGEFPVAAHAAATRSGGTALEIVGDQVERLTYGIAVAKAETALRDAVAAALDRLIANGEYARVLRRWAVEDGALEKATVNGGR